MDDIAKEWLISRNIIAKFLRELRPDQATESHQHNAAAILARLAQHEPPILTGFAGPDPEIHAELLAACEDVAGHLAYLRNLWGDEGVTRRVCERLADAIAKAKGV